MFEFFYTVGSFIDKGGDVLIVIFLVAFLMWSLILDKLYFQVFLYPKNDKSSTFKNKYISKKEFLQKKSLFDSGMSLIKISIVVSPLLGLLGTVNGMIEVFDVIAILGNSDPKAMSSGISQATIPTMVGMSVALSGIIFKTYLEQNNKKKLRLLAEKLQVEFKGKKR